MDNTMNAKVSFDVEMNAVEALSTLRNQNETKEKTKGAHRGEERNDDELGGSTPLPPKEKLRENDDFLSFQRKLFDLLENEEHSSIISWLPEGNAFVIRNKTLLETSILPKYFYRQSKYRSFIRRLQRWGFKRILRSTGFVAYSHKLFLKGRLDLCKKMTCMPSVRLTVPATQPIEAAHVHQYSGNNYSFHPRITSVFNGQQQQELMRNTFPMMRTYNFLPPGFVSTPRLPEICNYSDMRYSTVARQQKDRITNELCYPERMFVDMLRPYKVIVPSPARTSNFLLNGMTSAMRPNSLPNWQG